jgi:hypothetical protein
MATQRVDDDVTFNFQNNTPVDMDIDNDTGSETHSISEMISHFKDIHIEKKSNLPVSITPLKEADEQPSGSKDIPPPEAYPKFEDITPHLHLY